MREGATVTAFATASACRAGVFTGILNKDVVQDKVKVETEVKLPGGKKKTVLRMALRTRWEVCFVLLETPILFAVVCCESIVFGCDIIRT